MLPEGERIPAASSLNRSLGSAMLSPREKATCPEMIPCGYCGKQNQPTATHCCDCGTELRSAGVPEAQSETPPELPSPRYITPEALLPALDFVDGFHRADWDFVRQWIESNVDPLDWNDAWSEAALLWVKELRDDLGGTYFILQSGKTILLCDRSLETAFGLLGYAGRVAMTIQGYLGRTARDAGVGKDVVLVFSDQDDYYQYLSHHSPDGEQAASGGVCVHSGYSHIAMPWHDELDAANTIVHELTHDCLSHLPLPLWLNEGVAETMRRAIAPPPRAMGQGEQSAVYAALANWRPPMMWDELAERHFGFWTEENIQSFWAGTSFYQPGDPNELSYSLAEVFVKLLSERAPPDTFHAFLHAAHHDDAGQTAAMNILGADLGEIAGTFLGEGNWRPQRRALIARWESAGWQKGSGNADVPPEPRPL